MTQDDNNRCENDAEICQTADFTRAMVQEACVEWESDLKGFLLGVLRSRDLAEDAYQKTVIRAIQSAQSVRAETLRGWLFRIALNESRQLLRQRKRDTRHLEQFAEQDSIGQTKRQSDSNSGWMQSSGIVKAETIQAIQQSLVRLPVEQQEVIRRRIYEDQTFAEIAEQMQLPLGTVLTWMRRGLLRLKQDSQLRAFVEGN